MNSLLWYSRNERCRQCVSVLLPLSLLLVLLQAMAGNLDNNLFWITNNLLLYAGDGDSVASKARPDDDAIAEGFRRKYCSGISWHPKCIHVPTLQDLKNEKRWVLRPVLLCCPIYGRNRRHYLSECKYIKCSA